MDIFPTIAEIVGLPAVAMQQPQDGISLTKVFKRELPKREKLIPFQCFGSTVLLDNHMKLLHFGKRNEAKRYELYDLSSDPKETNNLYSTRPDVSKRMTGAMDEWKQSIEASFAGKDYAEGKLLPGDPEPRSWTTIDKYRPYFDEWEKRPEYERRIKASR
jgi:arylsulfatase A-like enzyme